MKVKVIRTNEDTGDEIEITVDNWHEAGLLMEQLAAQDRESDTPGARISYSGASIYEPEDFIRSNS